MYNLILGSSGKIGFYYKNYSKLKNNIYVSRKNSKKKKTILFNLLNNKVAGLLKKKNFTKAVIFTSISNPNDCLNNISLSRKINVQLTKNLIDELISRNIYFIFFSSEYVFLSKNKIITESQKTNSKMLYGKQKIEIEKYIKSRKYKNCSILRLSKTFGFMINDKTLFTNILQQYKNGKRYFEIANDQYFKPLFVLDLVKIIDIFLTKKISGLFNVCGDTYNSRYQLIKYMFKILNIKDVNIKKVSIKKFQGKINIPKYLKLSNRKIKYKINFKFSDLNKAIKKINYEF